MLSFGMGTFSGENPVTKSFVLKTVKRSLVLVTTWTISGLAVLVLVFSLENIGDIEKENTTYFIIDQLCEEKQDFPSKDR